MRAAAGVWRWRHNPLRRPTDLIEAWTALAAALMLLLAAPAVGWFAGNATEDSLRQAARQQRMHRHPVVATVLRPAPPPRSPASEAEPPPARERPRTVWARWTSVDGVGRTGRIAAPPRDARAGDELTVWTDRAGRVVARPMEPAAVRVHAVLAGTGFAFASAGLVEAVRRLVLWRLSQRRFARLDRAWAAAGPDWGRTGAGS
ncbi:hypothetical protein [Streptomyces sp. NPDC014894]|uniref:Rv1733c family protein n=1 Tax=Streptomyces sp. NPDC014894 TaxID=3364931 RepID=UPI0036F6D06F